MLPNAKKREKCPGDKITDGKKIGHKPLAISRDMKGNYFPAINSLWRFGSLLLGA